MSSGFSSHYLTEGANAHFDDWECVCDLCSTCRLTYWAIDLTAYWSKKAKRVAFGNSWAGVPDMPSDRMPTEKQIDAWVDLHKDANAYLRHYHAALERRKAWESQMKKTQQHLDKHGCNWAVVGWDFAKPKLAMVCAGIQNATQFLKYRISTEIKNAGLIRVFVGNIRQATLEVTKQRWVIAKRGLGVQLVAYHGSKGFLGRDELADYNSEGLGPFEFPQIGEDQSSKLCLIPKNIDKTIDNTMLPYVACDANHASHLWSVLYALTVSLLENNILGRFERMDILSDDSRRFIRWWDAGFSEPRVVDGRVSTSMGVHKDVATIAKEITIRKLRQYRPDYSDYSNFPVA